MAWDTEATKRRLLDAGCRQFSRHGFAGARMDAIGADAGVNKERVYQYFGNKRAFFDAVLADRLTDLLHAAWVEGEGPDAVAAYAGILFDRFAAEPDLARLLAWESLELDVAADGPARALSCAARVSDLRRALPGATARDAAHLLLTVITLAAGWVGLARVADMVTPSSATAERRVAVVTAAAAVARTVVLKGDPVSA